jgi:hypothetical protein
VGSSPGRREGSRQDRPEDDDPWISGSSPEEDGHRSRRDRRRDDLARQRATLRDRRTSEPASPVGVIVVILLLAVLVLGIGGGLPRLLHRGSEDQGPVGLLTPGGSGTEAPQTPGSPVSSGTPGATQSLSAPPIQTQRPGAVETASADATAKNWATLFYTRAPANETYGQLVGRAAEFTTSDLESSFSSTGDATYDALKASGGTSKAMSVTVGAPRPDTAPVDTPTRITRLVTITVATTGKDASQFEIPLLLTMIPEAGRWLVSAVDGGTGP